MPAPALLTNIRLGWKLIAVANLLAYQTAVKSFIVSAHVQQWYLHSLLKPGLESWPQNLELFVTRLLLISMVRVIVIHLYPSQTFVDKARSILLRPLVCSVHASTSLAHKYQTRAEVNGSGKPTSLPNGCKKFYNSSPCSTVISSFVT
jgi:hypothetical protein